MLKSVPRVSLSGSPRRRHRSPNLAAATRRFHPSVTAQLPSVGSRHYSASSTAVRRRTFPRASTSRARPPALSETRRAGRETTRRPKRWQMFGEVRLKSPYPEGASFTRSRFWSSRQRRRLAGLARARERAPRHASAERGHVTRAPQHIPSERACSTLSFPFHSKASSWLDLVTTST